jgi:hypothetical protein
MITVKDLIQGDVKKSPDGEHWEPAVPQYIWWRTRLRDAVAVLKGEAVAIRQTTKADLAHNIKE